MPGHSLDRLLVVQNAVNRLFEFFGEAEQMVHVPDADTLVMNLRGGLLYALALGQEHRPGEGVDECEHCACSLADVELLVPTTLVERDLLRDRAGSLTSRPPLTVTPATMVRRVLQLMNQNSVGCVGIVKDGRLVGIFSERDALLKLGTDAASLGDYPVSEFMTANPKTLKADAKIAFAVRHMDQGGFRHLPIVSETNELIGLVSVRDILRYVAERM